MLQQYDKQWLADKLNSGMTITQLASLCGSLETSMSQFIKRHLQKKWEVRRGLRGDEVHNT